MILLSMLLVAGVTVVACVILLLACFKFLMVSCCWHPLSLKVHKNENFLASILNFVLFHY
jgi:hypothetical protein